MERKFLITIAGAVLVFSIGIVTQNYNFKITPVRAFSFLSFPKDHGAHTSFKSEWWYSNMMVRTTKADGSDQRDLAYVLSFSRIFGANNLLSSRYDNTTKAFRQSTNQNGSLSVQLIDGDKLKVQYTSGLIAATLQENPVGADRKKIYRLSGKTAEMGSFDLTLKERTVVSSGYNTPLLWGGVTGNCTGKISVFAPGDTYYYSIPDLDITGSIVDIDGVRRIVKVGKAWIDHQWFSSSPPAEWRGHYWTNFHFTTSGDLYGTGPHQAYGYVKQVFTGGFKNSYWVKRNEDGTNECGTGGSLTINAFGSTNYPSQWQLSSGNLQAKGITFSDNQIYTPPIGPKFVEEAAFYSGSSNGKAFTGLGFFETHLTKPLAN